MGSGDCARLMSIEAPEMFFGTMKLNLTFHPHEEKIMTEFFHFLGNLSYKLICFDVVNIYVR